MTAKRKAIFISITFALCVIVPFYLILNWGYLPFQNVDYGVSYNHERLLVGQPLLEDYFYDKNPDWKRRKIWLTPDSLQSKHLHYGKQYWTEEGKIVLEKDFYDPINEFPIDTVLVRTYYFLKDSVAYQLTASKDQTNVLDRTLTLIEFDSIKDSWTSKLINNR
jgi:hypothetical protein